MKHLNNYDYEEDIQNCEKPHVENPLSPFEKAIRILFWVMVIGIYVAAWINFLID